MKNTKTGLPACYDPLEQEARRDQRRVAWLSKLPRCLGCGDPITSEMYLDLEPFGIQGRACERCCGHHMHYNDVLEDFYE